MLSVAFLASTFFAIAAPHLKAEARQRAVALVAQLGHPSFRVREKASNELAHLGSAALDALRRGVKHPDAEVSERCRKLLPQALDLQILEQMEVFLAKPDGLPPPDLPCVQHWLKTIGSGKEARALYVQLVKEQRRLLLEIEQDPDHAATRYQRFCSDIYERTRDEEPISFSELLLFLFLGSDANCRKNSVLIKPGFSTPSSVFLNSSHLSGLLSGDTANAATKQLFLAWLEQERHRTLVRRGYMLAVNADLKEVVPVAIRAAADKSMTPTERTAGLLSVAGLVGPEHLKQLEALLQDRLVVGRTTLNEEMAATEIRDIALGIMIQVTDQKPSDYGFERLRDNPGVRSTSSYYYALTEEKREEALKKWNEWTAQHKR